MRYTDWIILILTLLVIVIYGTWKGRGSRNLKGFLLADRSMKWYTIALSIMATQASAVTFTSTPGQAFTDGMRFVQFYLGLPIAMVILCITAVPIFHKLGVYTAYEYLEKRFDTKTRILTTLIFLVSRGLAAGITIYAPSLLLSVMLGLDIQITSVIIGGIVIIYTTSGGVKAVNYTDFLQLIIIMAGMLIAFVMAIHLLPSKISVTDAFTLSAAMGKLNTIDFSFDFSSKYNIWSGIIGGMFVALAYFGTDQSQVQRYLTGKTIAQSRMALLFNGMAKVPMQFFILLIGVIVFVFFQFVRPPLVFNPVEAEKLKSGSRQEEFQKLEAKHNELFKKKSDAIDDFFYAKNNSTQDIIQLRKANLLKIQKQYEDFRKEAANIENNRGSESNGSESNYVFLSFVLTYLPVGLVGLIFACIFAASMSSSSGELSALATISIIDIYRRFIKRKASEKHYLIISRIMMAFWGMYGIFFAQYAGKMGSLVEAVNILGSLFYGTMLGIFILAFFFKSVGGTPAFIGAIAGEIIVFYCFKFTDIAWLWYNIVGCIVVVGAGIILSKIILNKSTGDPAASQPIV